MKNICGCILFWIVWLFPEDGDYWVLDTDYENYSVVWSCVNSGGQSLRKFPYQILIRNQFCSLELRDRIILAADARARAECGHFGGSRRRDRRQRAQRLQVHPHRPDRLPSWRPIVK